MQMSRRQLNLNDHTPPLTDNEQCFKRNNTETCYCMTSDGCNVTALHCIGHLQQLIPSFMVIPVIGDRVVR